MTACGIYLLAEEEKRLKRKYWIYNVFWVSEEEGKFHTLFGRLKDDRQQIFQVFSNQYFEIWKPETVVAHRHWKEEYAVGTQRNRRTTGFNFKVSSQKCIILYNLLSPLSSEQVKHIAEGSSRVKDM